MNEAKSFTNKRIIHNYFELQRRLKENGLSSSINKKDLI
jgi:hypothetical protein